MKSFFQKIFLPALLLAPITVFAGEPAGAQQSPSFNPVLLGLVSIVVVLIAAIAILANVYKQLALVYRDKIRKEGSKAGNAVKTAVLLMAAGLLPVRAMAQEAANKTAEGAAQAAEQASLNISGIPRMDFYALVTIIGFELLAILVFLGMIYHMVRTLRELPERRPLVYRLLNLNILDRFNRSVSVEKEATIMLDHDYDGIHELDNSLPPWWKWGFVFTILFAGTYLWYYHFGDGPNQAQEYAAAVEKAEAEKAVYMAKAGNAVDEHNVTLIADKGELAAAATLFNNTCAACHREDAGGNVGPNLTDNYWLHGGKLQDVFKSIKYGWKDKGMPEWQHNMSARQIAGLASYVKSLSGRNVPGGKAPQGDLFTEGSNSEKADSVKKTTTPTASLTTDSKQQKG
jgi:cytochrome c oxidase cbb3-type subunit 3